MLYRRPAYISPLSPPFSKGGYGEILTGNPGYVLAVTVCAFSRTVE